jgi:hypothetical protein
MIECFALLVGSAWDDALHVGGRERTVTRAKCTVHTELALARSIRLVWTFDLESAADERSIEEGHFIYLSQICKVTNIDCRKTWPL